MGGWRYPRPSAVPVASYTGGTPPDWTLEYASTPYNCGATVSLGAYQWSTQESFSIGAVGSESPIIQYIKPSYGSTSNSEMRVPFLLRVKAGSRLSITEPAYMSRIICDPNVTGKNVFSGCDVIGFDSGNHRGTSVVGGTAGVKGAWVQLSSATTRRYAGIVIAATGTVPMSAKIDVGLTSSPADMIIISDWMARYDSSDSDVYPTISPVYITDIPIGSEVHVRLESSSSTYETAYVTIYGLW